MPVLDTAFLIDARRDPTLHRHLERFADAGEAHLVPAQAAVEYASGMRDPLAAIREVSESFVLRPFDADLAREAARLAREAKHRGTFPGWADTQVGATARYEGMCVLTRNVRHFREGLGVAAWDYANEPAPPR